MHKKFLLAAILVLPVFAAQAQSTPTKKALVVRILKVQQVGIEAIGRTLAERPALEILDRAGDVLNSRVAPEQREAISNDIQADVKAYLDDTVPLVRDRAVKLAPSTIGAVMEEKFSEDELRQMAVYLESPAYNKYQQLGGDMQKTLLEKLLADTRTIVEPKINTLDQTVAKRLGVTIAPNAAAPAK